ncbi:hypothetical protein MycrhN_1366 [Mycolicibacterium rhodesiae NBB3]|uniref:DUF7159 domain-containing protein n=1 Tax=Mycolicibacterium rhodesiae (strain NBB3) TaxID=710685 RepID=G8RY93_MYCRN|nr:hypothetical protein [Mycolicibacterium rhodesiae]AEV71984.1 hypothetical protein MycrhN_1366 [Mycolicibacterium rhodesiae NBB3]
MDIVLGVSTTPTTVRMVLVEGEMGDGLIVDHDSFDVTANDGSANSAATQVVEAVLGTQESAAVGGHSLKAIGVTWSDHAEGAALRDALTANGLDDVMLVSAGHAAAELAQAAGRAVGHHTTALLFVDRDTATLSVVQTDDGSVVKVLSRSLHSTDAMAVLTEMAAAVDAQDSPPQGMFVVGSGVDVSSVKQHLRNLVTLPVSAPEEPELALARGAALAAANAPALESSTVGLAYSQDPDGPTAGSALAGLANAETQLAAVGSDGASLDDYDPQTEMQLPAGDRKPFLLVGSALTSIFIVGVVALVISLAVSIRPTADQRPSPGQNALVPTVAPTAPGPAPAPEAAPVEAPPPPPTAAQTIKPPVPVAQQVPQAPPRTVYVEAPPPAAPPPAAPPAPAAPPPAPAPAAPAPIPAPVYVPPPVYNPPPVYRPWNPPWQPRYLPKPWQPPQWNPPWEDDEPEAPQLPQQPELPQLPQTPQLPQAPQVPQVPQSPQSPSFNGGGSNGSGSGSGSSRGPQYPGSGSSGRGGNGGGGGCFLIFCSR